MEPSFEPTASSNPRPEQLDKWWQAVSKRIRDSYDHKAIPVDLKAAMKGRAKRYMSAVGAASDVVDLAAEEPVVSGLALEAPGFVDTAAEVLDVGAPSAKRSRLSNSRSRVSSSSSSSSQVEPDAGGGRNMLSRPQPLRGGRVPASGSVGTPGALSAEEVKLFKALLNRVLERL